MSPNGKKMQERPITRVVQLAELVKLGCFLIPRVRKLLAQLEVPKHGLRASTGFYHDYGRRVGLCVLKHASEATWPSLDKHADDGATHLGRIQLLKFDPHVELATQGTLVPSWYPLSTRTKCV